MKKKYRISKPCLECGGGVPKMNEGGMNPMQMQASAPVKESAVGMCTGTNFGGPDCPKGSPQYELALKFRKEKATIKKKEAASVAEQGADIDSTIGQRNEAYKNYIASNATNVIEEEEMIQAMNQPQHQMPDGTMMPGAQHMSRYGGVPEYFVGGIGPETEQQVNNQNELSQARYDQQFSVDGPMKRIEPKPIVTDINAIINAGQFKGTQAQNNLLDKDTDLLKTKGKLKNGVGKFARQNLGKAMDLLPQFSPHQVDWANEKIKSTYANNSFTANRDADKGSIGFNDFGLAEDPNEFTPVQFSGNAPRDINMSQYGGVPKYSLAGAVNYGYKANPFTNDLIQGEKDFQQGWDALGDLGNSWGDADLSDRMKWKTKVIDTDKNDGINTKKFLKDYEKYYNVMDDNDKMKDMFNMFARYGGQRELPEARFGMPNWFKDMFGMKDGSGSMRQRAEDVANTPQAKISKGYNYGNNSYNSHGTETLWEKEERLRKEKKLADEGWVRGPNGLLTNPGKAAAQYNGVYTATQDDNGQEGQGESASNNLIIKASTINPAAVKWMQENGYTLGADGYLRRGSGSEDEVEEEVVNNSGADAIQASNKSKSKSKSGSKSKSSSSSNTGSGDVPGAEKEEDVDPNYRGNANREGSQGGGYYNNSGRFITPTGRNAPIPTDYMDTKIEYRNNWLRPNKRRVKSIEYTHGVRGNNNGQGAQSFDPNNPTPEQLAYIQQMMGIKNSSDPNDPINMLTDGTYDNMNVPEFGDDQPNMDPYNPNAWNRDYLSYGYGEDQTPRIQGKGPVEMYGHTPDGYPYVARGDRGWDIMDEASYNMEDAAYKRSKEPEVLPDFSTDRTDAEAQEAYDQREAENNRAAMLSAEDELEADLASQRYGGVPRFTFGGPETGYGTPGYGVPDVSSQAGTQSFNQDKATMFDPMRNPAMLDSTQLYRNGSEREAFLNSSGYTKPEPTMELEPTNIAKERYNNMFNELENRRRANLVNDDAIKRQYGGDTTYQEGWEGEMSEDDLREFINGGGQVEFI